MSLLKRLYERARRVSALRTLGRLPVMSAVKRRVMGRLLPHITGYNAWVADHVRARRGAYPATAEPGLLSFLTPVWNTPVPYLRVLAESLLAQARTQPFEWVLLDNGSANEDTRDYLRRLARHPAVRFFRVEPNRGIVGGMRFCLEHAAGRYVLPLDSDDRLYGDSVAILAWHIRRAGHPAILYTDEDHLTDGRALLPYFKPDWDPVLCLNSAYIAHLGALDRRRALDLNVYGDADAEGCHDWDTFFKFVAAGHTPVHVPEIVYSWRMHQGSTAMNMTSKSFIHDSHAAVLRRFLDRLPQARRYHVEPSPLFAGTPDWWIRRRHTDARPLLSLVLGGSESSALQRVLRRGDYPDHQACGIPRDAGPQSLREPVRRQAARGGLVCLVSERVNIENPEWPWEVLALGEIHGDVAVVGGPLYGPDGRALEAGRHFGFGDGCGCPLRGVRRQDVGWNALHHKQRSVSAVSSQFCVFEAAFLAEFLDVCPPEATLPFLGAWAGAYALRTAKRVVYSPFLAGRTEEDWEALVRPNERKHFLAANRDIIPDTRYYPRLLDLRADHAFEPSSDAARQEHLRTLYQDPAN